MRTRKEISNIGTFKQITKVQDGIQFQKTPELRISFHEEWDNKEWMKGSYEVINFIPNSHGGRGLSIECTTEDKAGRYRTFQIEIGKVSTEVLIDFLKRNLDSLGEYSRDELLDIKGGE